MVQKKAELDELVSLPRRKLQTINFFFKLYTILICLTFFLSFFFLQTPVFEEPEDPSSRSFFSEIISSISDVKFSHSGRYMMTRDYLSVKVWDLNMENRPVETYQVLPPSHL